MKRILMVLAAVSVLALGGTMTSTAQAHGGPGYGRCYPNYGYSYVRTYPYRTYGYRVYSSPNVIITSPGFGLGFGTGYGYPASYPVYNNFGFYGW